VRILLLISCAVLLGAAPRSTTDFEIAALEKDIATARDSVARSAARLNLGDLLASRGKLSEARILHRTALADLTASSHRAREDGDLASYARALAYSGLAQAKLGDRGASIRTFEEVMRYGSNSDVLWNLRASAMSVLAEHSRAAAASRNAISLATDPLDLNVYRYALASALAARRDTGDVVEAEKILRALLDDLNSARFERIRREAANAERFEVLSAARGDAATWVSLQNRARLRLAALLEASGRREEAAQEYRTILAIRDDDSVALAGLARVTGGEDRSRIFEASFEANPFSPRLLAQYEQFLREGGNGSVPSKSSDGAAMRGAIRDFVDGRYSRAMETLVDLQEKHPTVTVIAELKRRIEQEAAEPMPIPGFLRSGSSASETGDADLRLLMRLLRADRLDQEIRASLDRTVLESVARFDAVGNGPAGTTTLAGGMIGSIPFRFPSPTAFAGTFDTAETLLLRYRVAGLSEIEGREVLVLDPVGVSKR
jgi:hypothetical protein